MSRARHAAWRTLLCALACLAACADPPALAPPPPTSPLEFLEGWGAPGDAPGKLRWPRGIAADAVGNIFVVDAGNRQVHKFSPRGTPLLSFSDPRLSEPAGMALDAGGAIYVADLARNSVLIFFPDGTFFRELRGGPGRPLLKPVGVSVDAAGTIFVLEGGADRIQKFNARRRFLQAWGRTGSGPGEFRAPSAIVATRGADAAVYVADAGNQRIQKFTPAGEFVAEWKADSPPAEPFVDATGLAAEAGALFVTDGGSHKVHVWTSEGKPLHVHDLASLLNLAGGRPTPAGAAVVPGRHLVVLDPAGPRVLRFRIHF